jgi:hypothetical protein
MTLITCENFKHIGNTCESIYLYIHLHCVYVCIPKYPYIWAPNFTVSGHLPKISSFKSIVSVCYNTTNYNHAKMTILSIKLSHIITCLYPLIY